MPFDVDRLLRLRFEPLPDDAAEAAFRELYNDPVSVNGEPVGTTELVARARALQAAIEWPNIRVLSVVDGGSKVTVVYRIQGRQIGPLTTAIGPVPATGRVVELRTIEVLTLAGGRVREIWTVANELGALAAVDAVWLSSQAPPDGGDTFYKPWEHEESEHLHGHDDEHDEELAG
ncbi:ester cyclase [Geodermatophilus sp. URMC 64]